MQIQSSAPPTPPTSPLNWVQKNLFSTWYNSILTIVCLAVIIWGLSNFISWALTAAQWGVVGANLRLFFVGRFPPELYWRVWTALGLIIGLAGLCWGYIVRNSPIFSRTILFVLGVMIAAIVLLPLELSARLWILAIAIIAIVGYAVGRKLPASISPWLTPAWGLVFIVNIWLIGGGLGLASVPTNVWSGLLLTLLTAICGIVLSFPFGVLLALGRQSPLPIVRILSILYIEVVRGLPLIGILFLAQVMLPLFLPPNFRNLDRVLRAIAGLVLFSAAYLAENIRGGLQAIPRGQYEAAKALGLSSPLVVLLIVLPQALKAVIPAIVGQFIGLFKDTSLLALFGLLELTGISRSILAQPQFLGRYAEVYLFIGLLYWLFCYGMSTASRYLERKLNVSN
ncbi:MAG: Inner membrane amino-acid ABC transporter permease protein YhdY [Chroococcidiopsis cubana SAG 39.79]|uniref:Polar amino acid ABC transporter permease n=1 Tax=Chroococcidiopsis cubana SAG 39.79 TaxID=388085 RepID=A0AB37UL63_9CYAN|nr:amino acid ABC transporter permease [Chroococcidiopsis cubana]MDZ4872630.1 Inner membrane amino-acid ABC transporter permease protein YhdY [Chroococcidiopsis cubana SAG 39.79]RUT12153.1 polar amino acid ABC transporter permease [Chroococcidiopsis cubana SAG 39.79]